MKSEVWTGTEEGKVYHEWNEVDHPASILISVVALLRDSIFLSKPNVLQPPRQSTYIMMRLKTASGK